MDRVGEAIEFVCPCRLALGAGRKKKKTKKRTSGLCFVILHANFLAIDLNLKRTASLG